MAVYPIALPRRAYVPLLLALSFAGCTSDQPAKPAEVREDLSDPDYYAIAGQLIKHLPTIITENDFQGQVDSATLNTLAPIVPRLNDALAHLVVLHEIYDTTISAALRTRVNLVAIPYRIIADRAKAMVQSELPANRQVWFHTFLEQRTSAAGLPHDVWSIEPGSPTVVRGIRPDSSAPRHQLPRDSGHLNL